MGGKRHASSPPATSPASPSVCCMCGDRGLEEELFQCRNCNTRIQHKYCSNQYPKVDRYIACNWCLREEGAKPQEPAGDQSASCSSTGGGFVGVKLRRRAFASLADEQPIKKQKLPLHGSAATTSPEREGSKTLPTVLRRAKAAACRVRVRRYKLLEEVTC